MKKLFCILLFSTSLCMAQQEPQYTMYMNNYSIFNPAATGAFYKHYLNIQARDQWQGLEKNPLSANFIYNYKVDKYQFGLGLYYSYDQLGFEKSNTIGLNLTRHHYFENDRRLSFGLGLKYKSLTLENEFLAIDPNDPLLKNFGTGQAFDLSFGTLYKTNHYIISLSSTQMLESEYSKLKIKNKRHYFLNFSYFIPINEKIEIRPGTLIKSDFSTWQIDINAIAIFKKQIWLGAGWRYQDAIMFMAGYDFKEKFRIGYSYDHTTSDIGHFSHGSHELMLAMMLNKMK